MATIMITREVPRWRDLLVRYQVLVDGAVVGSLAPGESCAIDVEEGEHVVQAQLRQVLRWRSPEMKVLLDSASPSVSLVISNGDPGRPPLQYVFSPRNYLSIAQTGPDNKISDEAFDASLRLAASPTGATATSADMRKRAVARLSMLALFFGLVSVAIFATSILPRGVALVTALSALLAVAAALLARRRLGR